MLTQRLGIDTQRDPRYIDAFIRIVKENPGSCDEVWLGTDFGYPKPETLRGFAAGLTDTAQKLRDAGLRVSLQIANTIGHGQYICACDCSGLVYDGSPAEKLVGHDGTVAEYCFCWNGRHFRDYIYAAVKAYVAAVQPYTVWVDDDLRPTNHNPVWYGCFCDGCMAKFNARYGSHFTREELVREINFGDKAWRLRHIEFMRDSLYDFTYNLGLAIHEACPEVRMGYQYAANAMITGYDYSFIFDAMYKATGFPPASRPGGGCYNDHDISCFVNKGEDTDMQNRMLPAYVTDKRPEIESLPDIVYGKSIAGTCFETSYYLSAGNTAMSYAILCHDYESWDWHGQMLAAFASHRKYWEKLCATAKDTSQGGLVYAMSRYDYLQDGEKPMDYTRRHYGMAKDFRYLGFSIAMKDEARDDDVRVLHHVNAKNMTDDEIKALLRLPVITDGETVRILGERGFELPVTAQTVNTAVLDERFGDHPICEGVAHRIWGGQFLATAAYEIILKDAGKTETVSEYITAVLPDTPEEECVHVANLGVRRFRTAGKVASAVFTTPYGAKWAVFGFDMWQRAMSNEKRNVYLNAAAYISGHRQSAELVTPIKALLQTRVNAAGELTRAGITNITVADSGEILVRVYRPAGRKATLMGQYTEPRELTLIPTENSDIFEIILPDLKPWAVCTIFFEN